MVGRRLFVGGKWRMTMGAAVDKDDGKIDGNEGNDGNDGMLAAARAYTRRGWRVVPVRPSEMSVAIVRWPEMRLDEGDLPKWFRGAAVNNIGILTGEPSGGLVDVDCDAPEAVLAAFELLPETGRISGRAGNPTSHYWYRIEGELPATTKFGDVGAVLSPSPLKGRGDQSRGRHAVASFSPRERRAREPSRSIRGHIWLPLPCRKRGALQFNNHTSPRHITTTHHYTL
jgi:bifunctional DNA primase/polymerase-like protein